MISYAFQQRNQQEEIIYFYLIKHRIIIRGFSVFGTKMLEELAMYE